MTREDAVIILRNWGSCRTIIIELEEDIRDLRRKIEYGRSISSRRLDTVPIEGRISKPTEEKAIKNIDRYEEEIRETEEKIKRLMYNKELVDDFINSLEITEQRLINMRYSKRKNWQAVSMKIYLSIRQCYRVHNKILDRMCLYFGQDENRL